MALRRWTWAVTRAQASSLMRWSGGCAPKSTSGARWQTSSGEPGAIGGDVRFGGQVPLSGVPAKSPDFVGWEMQGDTDSGVPTKPASWGGSTGGSVFGEYVTEDRRPGIPTKLKISW